MHAAVFPSADDARIGVHHAELFGITSPGAAEGQKWIWTVSPVEQIENAFSPIDGTLPGMLTLVRCLQRANASFPIRVTVNPFRTITDVVMGFLLYRLQERQCQKCSSDLPSAHNGRQSEKAMI